VVLADLDHFKQVNDKYGHLVGDHVLREVGNRLRSAIRPYDSAGRYGGEEFLILLPNMDLAAAKDRLEALHHQLTDSPVRLGERELQIGCSLGVTVVERGDASLRADDVLSRADAALYRAKDEGRGRISYSQ
jgi:diguanylate cyclase (GGDEF)-like protein